MFQSNSVQHKFQFFPIHLSNRLNNSHLPLLQCSFSKPIFKNGQFKHSMDTHRQQVSSLLLLFSSFAIVLKQIAEKKYFLLSKVSSRASHHQRTSHKPLDANRLHSIQYEKQSSTSLFKLHNTWYFHDSNKGAGISLNTAFINSESSYYASNSSDGKQLWIPRDFLPPPSKVSVKKWVVLKGEDKASIFTNDKR